MLPTKNSEEYKPFNRKLPEFKFWESSLRATLAALAMTLTRLFDIPVFWPILVIYFAVLFTLTMRDRLAHMAKHKYLPCSFGKKRYAAGTKGPGAGKPGGGGGGGGGGGAGGAAEPMFRSR
jgi:uncharacterized membrane protein YgcG